MKWQLFVFLFATVSSRRHKNNSAQTNTSNDGSPSDADPDVELGFFGLLDFPVHYKYHWMKCYNGSEEGTDSHMEGNVNFMVKCFGVCVARTELRSDLTEIQTFGCQETISSTARAHSENLCSDDVVSYPNDFVYASKTTGIVYYKYCCDSMLCNHVHQHRTIIPRKYVETLDDKTLMSLEIAQIVFILLNILFLSLYPFYLIREERNKEQRSISSLKTPLEQDILDNQSKHHIRHIRAKEPITGQPSLMSLYKAVHIMNVMKDTKRIERPVLDRKMTYQQCFLRAGGNYHDPVTCHRENIPRHDNTLIQLLEHGPYQYEWEPLELIELFDCAMSLVDAEPNLIHIDLPVAIVADIRGQYQDMHRFLSMISLPPRRKILFLGGIVDPEEQASIDCLALACALKIEYPQEVFILRGAPEAMPLNVANRFTTTAHENAVQSAAMRLFNYLPLAARLSNKVLCVYSGLSHLMSNPGCFTSIHRPFAHNDLPQLASDLLFNQPTMKMSMYRRDVDLGYQYFGLSAIERVCHDVKVDMIIRGGNPLPDGVCFFAGGKMISLWSAPNKHSTRGCAMTITHRMEAIIWSIEAQKKK